MTMDWRASGEVPTRRALLGSLGAGLAASLAGCGGDGDDGTPQGTEVEDAFDDGGTDNSSGNGSDATATEDGGSFSEQPIDRAALERAIAEEANRIRMANGAGLIDWDEELRGIARDHSEDMIRKEYFDHVDPMGRDIGDRYQAAGYDCVVQVPGGYSEGGETIARVTYEETPGREQIAGEVGDQWRTRDDARSSLLARHWDVHGVGIALDPTAEDTVIYVTQNFC